jgi:hypothetical protein
MTQEEFIEILDEKYYSYEIEGDKIIITYGGGVNLGSLTSLPPGVVFRNWGDVYSESLTSISPGVEFRNEGSVRLDALIGGWFDNWEGNIEGIEGKRLLNLMIKRGMFI